MSALLLDEAHLLSARVGVCHLLKFWERGKKNPFPEGCLGDSNLGRFMGTFPSHTTAPTLYQVLVLGFSLTPISLNLELAIFFSLNFERQAHCTQVESEEFVGVSFLLLPGGSQGLNSASGLSGSESVC